MILCPKCKANGKDTGYCGLILYDCGSSRIIGIRGSFTRGQKCRDSIRAKKFMEMAKGR